MGNSTVTEFHFREMFALFLYTIDRQLADYSSFEIIVLDLVYVPVSKSKLKQIRVYLSTFGTPQDQKQIYVDNIDLDYGRKIGLLLSISMGRILGHNIRCPIRYPDFITRNLFFRVASAPHRNPKPAERQRKKTSAKISRMHCVRVDLDLDLYNITRIE